MLESCAKVRITAVRQSASDGLEMVKGCKHGFAAIRRHHHGAGRGIGHHQGQLPLHGI